MRDAGKQRTDSMPAGETDQAVLGHLQKVFR